MTHDLNHDLTFHCTHNQLCVPQYKVNVQSTWDIKLWNRSQLEIGHIKIATFRCLSKYIFRVNLTFQVTQDPFGFEINCLLSLKMNHRTPASFFPTPFLLDLNFKCIVAFDVSNIRPPYSTLKQKKVNCMYFCSFTDDFQKYSKNVLLQVLSCWLMNHMI